MFPATSLGEEVLAQTATTDKGCGALLSGFSVDVADADVPIPVFAATGSPVPFILCGNSVLGVDVDLQEDRSRFDHRRLSGRDLLPAGGVTIFHLTVEENPADFSGLTKVEGATKLAGLADGVFAAVFRSTGPWPWS